MQVSTGRLNAWVYALVILSLCLSSAVAQDVRLIGGLPFGAVYVPRAWSPMRVEVQNDGKRSFDGLIRMSPLGEQSPEFRSHIMVPAQARVSITTWLYLLPGNDPRKYPVLSLFDSAGKNMARTEVGCGAVTPDLIRPLRGLPSAGYLIGVVGDLPDQSEEGMVQGLADLFKLAKEVAVVPSTMRAADLLRQASWFRDAYAMALVACDPDRFDQAQRTALLDYVAGGGVLIVSAPDAQIMGRSWLAPYLPVKLIGNRQFQTLQALGESKPRQLSGWLSCAEAVAGDGRVVLEDGQYVHAAYRPMGMGRIVFTSFPVSGMNVADVQAQALWMLLLDADRPAVGPWGSTVATDYATLMTPMLGKAAVPWGVAAGVACALLAMSLAAQFVWRGVNRPRAFAVSLGAAVAVGGVFAVLAMLRQQTEPVQEARLSISDLNGDGGIVYEYAAVSGPPQKATRQGTDENVAMRLAAWRGDKPILSQWPARIEAMSIQPDQANIVTLSSRVKRGGPGASVAGRFDAQGLTLIAKNDLGQVLESGQLVWGANRLSLPAIQEGEQHIRVGTDRLRPADEFTSSSGIASQDAQLKGDILKASLRSAALGMDYPLDVRPVIVAWAPRMPALADVTDVPIKRGTAQNMVRLPLQIAPSEPGSRVLVPGCFTRIALNAFQGLPYDFARQQFARTQTNGVWTFGIATPPGIGRLRPTRVKLSVDLACAQQKVTLRRGQVASGKVRENGNSAGAIVGDWDGVVGLRTAEFGCVPDDYDSRGIVWLQLQVEQTGSRGALGVDPQWHLARFVADVEGDVLKK